MKVERIWETFKWITDDCLGATHGAHVGTLERVLDGDKSLHSEGHSEPNAETRRDGATINQRLTPAVFIE